MAGWLGRGVNASQIAEDMDDNSSLHSTAQLTHDEVQARIDDVERKQKQVEAALQGCGSYLGINDHDGLIAALHSLRKKGEQLREEKRLLQHPVKNNLSTAGSSDGDSPAENYRGGEPSPDGGWMQRLQGDIVGPVQQRPSVPCDDPGSGTSQSGGGRASNVAEAKSGGEGAQASEVTITPGSPGVGMGVDATKIENDLGRPPTADAARAPTSVSGSTERPNAGTASVAGGSQGAGPLLPRPSDEEAEEPEVEVLAVEGRAQKRYKRSEKIDVEDPNTWTKGQLRCALAACGMPSVCRIKAAGRDGQQQLARLVFQFWGSPRKKLLSQQAAVGMAGEGFDPGPLGPSWKTALAAEEARSGNGGGGSLASLELLGQRLGGTGAPAEDSARKDDAARRNWMYRPPGVEGVDDRVGNPPHPPSSQPGSNRGGPGDGSSADLGRDPESQWRVQSVRPATIDDRGAAWGGSGAGGTATPSIHPSAPAPSGTNTSLHAGSGAGTPSFGAETSTVTLDMFGLENLPPRRYKRSEKIDVEDPFTWSKGQLRCALYACGVPNVKNIKAPGREGQQHLARLVFGLWGSPKKKLLSQQAAIGMAKKNAGMGASAPGEGEGDSGEAVGEEAGQEGAAAQGEGREVGVTTSENGQAQSDGRLTEDTPQTPSTQGDAANSIHRSAAEPPGSAPPASPAPAVPAAVPAGGDAVAPGALVGPAGAVNDGACVAKEEESGAGLPAEVADKMGTLGRETAVDVCGSSAASDPQTLADIVRPANANAAAGEDASHAVMLTPAKTERDGCADGAVAAAAPAGGKVQSDGEAETPAPGHTTHVLGSKTHPPKRKRSEKIDIEAPNTWTKGQLRCALSACGVSNVKGIKAPGRDGQQHLARLVAQFWGTPRKKLFAQKAAVSFVGEGFDPGPAAWNTAAEELAASGGGSGNAVPGFSPPSIRQAGAKSKDVKRPSHVPQGAVAKLEELIASFGLETATSQQFVSYQGSKYIMSDVLQLVNKTLQQPTSSSPGESTTPGAGATVSAATAVPMAAAAAAPVPTTTAAAGGAGVSTVGANGIFRLLNILFQEPMRQLWLECEKRTDGATANGVLPGRSDPFWSYATKLLLDPEHDAGGLLPGSGDMLVGLDPRIVDMPPNTGPKDVKDMFVVTRTSYNLAKGDHAMNHGNPNYLRMLLHGKPDAWYLSLWIQTSSEDGETYCDAMMASAISPRRPGMESEVTGNRAPAGPVGSMPGPKSPLTQPGAPPALASAASPGASTAPGVGGATSSSPGQDAAGGAQIPGAFPSMVDQLASALGNRRAGSVDVAPAEHVLKAEMEVRAWEAHSALSTTLEEEEAKPERQRNPAKIAYLRARVKSLFEEIVAAAPVR